MHNKANNFNIAFLILVTFLISLLAVAIYFKHIIETDTYHSRLTVTPLSTFADTHGAEDWFLTTAHGSH